MRYFLFLSILLCSLFSDVFAEARAIRSSAILLVNNQAAFDVLYGYQAIGPIKNVDDSQAMHANVYGLRLVLNKTFLDNRLYTQFALQTLTGSFYLSNSSTFTSHAFASSNSFQQQVSARVGYSLYPTNTLAFTPYGLLGFQYWQIDTPGYFINEGVLGDLPGEGYTRVYQNGFYGIGLLMQWAVVPKWVTSLDLNAGKTIHPWVRYNYPVTNPSSLYYGVVIYQQADFSSKPFYQVSWLNDYQLSSQFHARVGLSYLHEQYGGGTTSPILTLNEPTAASHTWLANVGVGYSFAGKDQDQFPSVFGNQETIEHVNNQANIQLGYLYQNYGEIVPQQMHYLDRQQGGMPQVALELIKTFSHVYTDLKLSNALGHTAYLGEFLSTGAFVNASTRNSIFDTSFKFGYSFSPKPSIALTPYATTGFHHWFRDILGSYIDGGNIGGAPESYQHLFYGAGLLTQWAITSQWVLALDGQYGKTWNPQANTDTNITNVLNEVTTYQRFSLGSRPYYDIALRSDYAITTQWHAIAQVDYLRFRYGKSAVLPTTVYEPASRTRELTSSVGLGYSFG